MSVDISSKFIKAFWCYLFLEKGNKNVSGDSPLWCYLSFKKGNKSKSFDKIPFCDIDNTAGEKSYIADSGKAHE